MILPFLQDTVALLLVALVARSYHIFHHESIAGKVNQVLQPSGSVNRHQRFRLDYIY